MASKCLEEMHFASISPDSVDGIVRQVLSFLVHSPRLRKSFLPWRQSDFNPAHILGATITFLSLSPTSGLYCAPLTPISNGLFAHPILGKNCLGFKAWGTSITGSP